MFTYGFIYKRRQLQAVDSSSSVSLNSRLGNLLTVIIFKEPAFDFTDSLLLFCYLLNSDLCLSLFSAFEFNVLFYSFLKTSFYLILSCLYVMCNMSTFGTCEG